MMKVSFGAVVLPALALFSADAYSINTYNRFTGNAYVEQPPTPQVQQEQQAPVTTAHEQQPVGMPQHHLHHHQEPAPAMTDQTPLLETDGSDIVGDKYILSSGAPKESSGKSFIYEAQDRHGGESVIVKLSPNTEALIREAENYRIISERSDGTSNGLFVQVHDYMDQANPHDSELKDQAALVMEKGEQDLKSFLQEHGPMYGPELQHAAYTAAKCVAAVHDKEMVWTEVKAPNFVTKKERDSNGNLVIKGIDLESAVPRLNHPIDYSPEACPPEFAIAFLCGREPFIQMDYDFHVWSLGMLFYKLSTGHGYFDTETEDRVVIAQRLKQKAEGYVDLKQTIQDDDRIDADMKHLIQCCLNTDPQDRPTVHQILQHSFFQK